MFPRLAAFPNIGESPTRRRIRISPVLALGKKALTEDEGRVGSVTASALDSHAWDDLQVVVRSFRQAIKRGERPAIEAYAPEGIPDRKALLLELVHEELEVRITAGEPLSLVQYLDRFPELSSDPAALLAGRRSAPRPTGAGGFLTKMRGTPEAPAKAESTAKPPVQISRHDLQNVIGQGACGVVYRAWDTVLTRPGRPQVRPRAGDRETPEAIERFVREARSTAALRHPHIVPIYDAGQFDGQSYWSAPSLKARIWPTR